MCTKCAFIFEMINFEECNKFLSIEEKNKKEITNSFYGQLLNSHKIIDWKIIKLWR